MAEKKIPRVDLPPDVRLDTLSVREGLPPSAWGENSEALFLTSSFRQPDAATAAARFGNEEEGFIYSRFTNPTVMMFERRLAALEGAQACIATASGMSAILLLVMGLLKAGDHVVCSRSVFGTTIMLFGRGLPQTHYDNVRLDLEPLDVPPASIARAVEISWPSRLNEFYRVERATRVENPDWTPITGTLAGTGNRMAIFEVATDQARYYRLVPVAQP